MGVSKKIISIIGACSILAGLMVGCAQNGNGETKKATIWMSVGHSKDFWEAKVLEYNKTEGKKLGVELVLECKTDDSYSQALNIAKQSNQLPEFFSDGGCMTYEELGIVQPINEIKGMEKLIEKYSSLMQSNVHKVGDKVYSIPFGMTTRGLIYNKDMFRAAGIVDENGEPTPPKTYAELREYAKRLTNEAEGKYGIVFPIKWASWVDSDINTLTYSSAGTNAYDRTTGKWDYTVYEPILETIVGIKEDGSYYPGAEGLDNDPARARFAAGNIGMKMAYSFDVGVLNDQFPMEADWGVAPLPVENTDECYNQFAGVGLSVSVSKTGYEKLGDEAVSSIMNYLYSDDSIRELYIQGKEIPCLWDVVEDVELTNPKKGWAEFAALASVSAVPCWEGPVKLDGKESWVDIVKNRIWTNGEEILPLLEQFTALSNEGAEKYKELNPDKDLSYSIDKDWNEKARREQY